MENIRGKILKGKNERIKINGPEWIIQIINDLFSPNPILLLNQIMALKISFVLYMIADEGFSESFNKC